MHWLLWPDRSQQTRALSQSILTAFDLDTGAKYQHLHVTRRTVLPQRLDRPTVCLAFLRFATKSTFFLQLSAQR